MDPAPEPISPYDTYSGTYDRENMALVTPDGVIKLDRAPLWLVDGQFVIMSGECHYESFEDMRDCGKTPTKMIIAEGGVIPQ